MAYVYSDKARAAARPIACSIYFNYCQVKRIFIERQLVIHLLFFSFQLGIKKKRERETERERERERDRDRER